MSRAAPLVVLPKVEFSENKWRFQGRDDKTSDAALSALRRLNSNNPDCGTCWPGEPGQIKCDCCGYSVCSGPCFDRQWVTLGSCCKAANSFTLQSEGCCGAFNESPFRVCGACFSAVIPQSCRASSADPDSLLILQSRWKGKKEIEERGAQTPVDEGGMTLEQLAAELQRGYLEAHALYHAKVGILHVQCQDAMNQHNSAIMQFMAPLTLDQGAELLPPPIVCVVLSYHRSNYVYFPIVAEFLKTI